tara:strand:- start:367 stop:534 length:168 start_codon:yes stop_codon:yes gene_type:complete
MSKPIDKKIETMKEAISWFRKQIEPHDCGWMYTTIDGMKHYISKLRKDKRSGKRR